MPRGELPPGLLEDPGLLRRRRARRPSRHRRTGRLTRRRRIRLATYLRDVRCRKVWHYWIGLVLRRGRAAPCSRLVVGYLVKVVAPQYPPATRQKKQPAMVPGRRLVDWAWPSGVARLVEASSRPPGLHPAPRHPASPATLTERPSGAVAEARREHRAASRRRRPRSRSSTAPAGSGPTSPRSSASCGPLLDKVDDQVDGEDGLGVELARRDGRGRARHAARLDGARVLGQYDLLGRRRARPPTRRPRLLVGPNLLVAGEALRLPAAASSASGSLLHEVTHRAQFTGVPWMRGYFRASSTRR